MIPLKFTMPYKFSTYAYPGRGFFILLCWAKHLHPPLGWRPRTILLLYLVLLLIRTLVFFIFIFIFNPFKKRRPIPCTTVSLW